MTSGTDCPSPRWPLYYVAAAYALLAIILTYPLILAPASTLPAGSMDVWSNYWTFWWWKYCLWGLRENPFRCNLLYFPYGTDAIFHTHSFFNMFFSAPINLLLGEAAAYNFCILFAIASSGFFAFLLARELTGDNQAAFLAGLIYAAHPQRLEFSMEQLNILSSQFVPLTLLYFRRASRDGRVVSILGFGASYALNGLADWHNALQLTLLLMCAVTYYLAVPPRPVWLLLRDWMIAGAMATLILSPVLFPMILEMARGEIYFQKQQVNKEIDAAFLFFPHFEHPAWGSWFSDRYRYQAMFAAPGLGCYLGWVAAGLAIVGAAKSPRRAWKWIAVFAATLVLALGRAPHVLGY